MPRRNEPRSAALPASLAERVVQRLRALAPTARRVVVAVSGGLDSVAALRLLHDGGWDVAAAHFDHRLRPDSSDDASFVVALCASSRIPVYLGSADVAEVAARRGWNVEDAARRLRYAFLHRVAAGEVAPVVPVAPERGAGPFDAIVVAHTRDDQAETMLFQLLRGAAFPTGMAPRRGLVVRPLLEIDREALRAYMMAAGQSWREDASNLDVGRSRAWLRHEVIPLLERRLPGAGARIAQAAETLRDARDALEREAERRFGAGSMHTTALARSAPALRHAALAGAFRRAGAAPTRAAIVAVDEVVQRAARAGSRAEPWRRDVGNGVVARVAYGRLDLLAGGAAAPVAPFDERRIATAQDLPGGVAAAVLERYPDLVLRRRRPGDRIHLPGGTKRVADLLIDRKVPREARDRLRMLASGSEVVWIDGVEAAAGVASAPVDVERAFMLRALELARRAVEQGEMPVGAVVVQGGEIVGEAHNLTEARHDPTAHAEMLALRQAAERTGDWRLANATLVVTLEPCPMCLGAVLQTHLTRVVYGADNLREGALGSVVDLRAGGWKRAPEVVGGVLAGESAGLLRSFFARRRDRTAG